MQIVIIEGEKVSSNHFVFSLYRSWVSGGCFLHSLQSSLDRVIYVMFALFQDLELPSADHFKLHTFEFNDFELTDDETILASIRMMLELDFLNTVHTKREVTDYTLT